MSYGWYGNEPYYNDNWYGGRLGVREYGRCGGGWIGGWGNDWGNDWGYGGDRYLRRERYFDHPRNPAYHHNYLYRRGVPDIVTRSDYFTTF